MSVTVDGFWIENRIYLLFDKARDYTLQFTITHTYTSIHSHAFTAVAC
jgi:hypothetical protein